MKTKLLICAVLFGAVLTTQAFGQKTIVESFDYPAGDINGLGGSTDGWGGPWASSSGVLNVVDGNLGNDLVGKSATTQTGGGAWVGYFRELSEKWMDDGNDIWISFYIDRVPTETLSWGGLSLFDGETEILFMGCPNELPFVGFDNLPTTVDDTLLNYLTVKLEMEGTLEPDSAFMWVNYFGNTEPGTAVAEQKQAFGSDGFSRIRIANGEIYSVSYDKIRISNTFSPNPETGIRRNNSNLFQVYMSPVTGHLKLSVKADKISILGIDGKLVATARGNDVDMNSLRSGVYFVKIVADGKVMTKKIFKQ